jgi:hypothetical protein
MLIFNSCTGSERGSMLMERTQQEIVRDNTHKPLSGLGDANMMRLAGRLARITNAPATHPTTPSPPLQDYMAPEVLRCPPKNLPQENKNNTALHYNNSVDAVSLPASQQGGHMQQLRRVPAACMSSRNKMG